MKRTIALLVFAFLCLTAGAKNSRLLLIANTIPVLDKIAQDKLSLFEKKIDEGHCVSDVISIKKKKSHSAWPVPETAIFNFDGQLVVGISQFIKIMKSARLEMVYGNSESSYWYTVSIPEYYGISRDEALKHVLAQALVDPSVEDVVPNYKAHIAINYNKNKFLSHLIIPSVSLLPNDPSFSLLWGLNNNDGFGTPDVDIDFPEGQELLDGNGADVVIGVVDTGIDYRHPDFGKNGIWRNLQEIPGNGIDDDHDGGIDNIYGYDLFDEDKVNDPMDENFFSHGTHISGTMRAQTNNNYVISGIAWKLQDHISVAALRAFGASGIGSYVGIKHVMLVGLGHGFKVFNHSWSGSDYSPELYDLFRDSGEDNVIHVCAAGNDGKNLNNPGNWVFPAAFDVPNRVTVAAINRYGILAEFSNYGTIDVQIGAPGDEIRSLAIGNNEGDLQGTSMATPHASIIMALIKSKYPAEHFSKQIRRLTDTAKPLPSLLNYVSTNGMPSIFNIFENDNVLPRSTSVKISIKKRTNVVLNFSATGDDDNVGRANFYEFYLSKEVFTKETSDIVKPVRMNMIPGIVGQLESFTIRKLKSATTYWCAIKVVDNHGNRSELSNIVKFKTKK